VVEGVESEDELGLKDLEELFNCILSRVLVRANFIVKSSMCVMNIRSFDAYRNTQDRPGPIFR
jgi:hypothetical protein